MFQQTIRIGLLLCIFVLTACGEDDTSIRAASTSNTQTTDESSDAVETFTQESAYDFPPSSDSQEEQEFSNSALTILVGELFCRLLGLPCGDSTLSILPFPTEEFSDEYDGEYDEDTTITSIPTNEETDPAFDSETEQETPPEPITEYALLSNITFETGSLNTAFTPDQTGGYSLDVSALTSDVTVHVTSSPGTSFSAFVSVPTDFESHPLAFAHQEEGHDNTVSLTQSFSVPIPMKSLLGLNAVLRIESTGDNHLPTTYTIDLRRAHPNTVQMRNILRAPSPTSYQGFGTSMDFDGTRLAVGQAYRLSEREIESNSYYNAETSVQILLKNGLEWVEETILNLPIYNRNSNIPNHKRNTNTFVKFSDDLLLIGETNHGADTDGAIPAAMITPNNNTVGAGAVHVYKRDADNNWNYFYLLKQSNAQGLGANIATSENQDGTTTIAATTRFDRNVTLFTRIRSDELDTITKSQVITVPTNSTKPLSDIQLSNDYLIVSAENDYLVDTNSSGIVYIYRKDPATGLFYEAPTSYLNNKSKNIALHNNTLYTNKIVEGYTPEKFYIKRFGYSLIPPNTRRPSSYYTLATYQRANSQAHWLPQNYITPPLLRTS